jgi:hypothetical protein
MSWIDAGFIFTAMSYPFTGNQGLNPLSVDQSVKVSFQENSIYV